MTKNSLLPTVPLASVKFWAITGTVYIGGFRGREGKNPAEAERIVAENGVLSEGSILITLLPKIIKQSIFLIFIKYFLNFLNVFQKFVLLMHGLLNFLKNMLK